jgi:hypothetical protein
MGSKYKPLGTEMALTTANTVSNANLVRIANDQATAVLITVNGAVTGTLTVLSKQEVMIVKQPTDTIAANAAVFATKVAYGD